MDCGSKPGGFSRMTYDVMQWIRKVKVNKKVSSKEKKIYSVFHVILLQEQGCCGLFFGLMVPPKDSL